MWRYRKRTSSSPAGTSVSDLYTGVGVSGGSHHTSNDILTSIKNNMGLTIDTSDPMTMLVSSSPTITASPATSEFPANTIRTRASSVAGYLGDDPRDKWVLVMTPKMKQWVTKMDGVDNLELMEGDYPVPKEGEVLVKIHTVSLNYRDLDVCNGAIAQNQPPQDFSNGLIPCSDMCGTVVETKSKLLKRGTRVMSIFLQSHLAGQLRESDLESGLGFPQQGVLAEYRCFPAEALVPVPKYLTNEEAACLPMASVTAWMALQGDKPLGHHQTRAAIKAEKTEARTVLLQGTGGVSVAGLQIAKAAGMKTIITSSSDDKLQKAEEDLGADVGINYLTHWEWQDPVMEATDGRGVDIVLETGGPKTLRKSFGSVAFGGTINCIGALSGSHDRDDDQGSGSGGEKSKAPLSGLNVNVLAVRRNVTLKGLVNGGKDRFLDMLKFYERKQIRPVVCQVFGMDEARDAMTFLSEGKHFGKVVIRID